MNDDEICRFVASGLWTRPELEQMVGRDEVVRLIAEGRIVDNPMTERLEVARHVEEFF